MAKCVTVIRSAFLGVHQKGLPSNQPELTAAAASNLNSDSNSVRVAAQTEQQQEVTVTGNTDEKNNCSPSALYLNVKEQRQQVSENFNIDWKNYSPCSICLDDFNPGNQCKVLMNCKHLYHRACIDKWLDKEKHCPFCRRSVRGAISPDNQRVAT